MTQRILISLLAITCLLPADTLILRNGSTIHGKFVGGDSRSIRFSIGSQVNAYDLADIDNLRFDGSSQASAPPVSVPPVPAPPVNYPPPEPPTRSSDAYPAAPPPVSGPSGPEVSAGTEISVRTIDSIDSKDDRIGQTYRASIDQPVMVNGQTVIPRGADAVVMLSAAQQSGKIEGKTVSHARFAKRNRKWPHLRRDEFDCFERERRRGSRSAKVIGGTAALGAIIGAIAGGGKGAAIGAGSGAAVGTAAQVVTSGQKGQSAGRNAAHVHSAESARPLKPVAVVTGGSRGIGRAIVEELARTHILVATYNSNREAAQAVADSTGAVMLPCQLGDAKSCQEFLAALRSRFEAIDLLVNNAGIAPRERRDILEATPESFDELFATNLKGPYFLTQQLARGMLERERGASFL